MNHIGDCRNQRLVIGDHLFKKPIEAREVDVLEFFSLECCIGFPNPCKASYE